MDTNEKRIQLARWILETDENQLNEVDMVYKSAQKDGFDISDEHKKILDERLKTHQRNPSVGKEWATIKKELSVKYGV